MSRTFSVDRDSFIRTICTSFHRRSLRSLNFATEMWDKNAIERKE